MINIKILHLTLMSRDVKIPVSGIPFTNEEIRFFSEFKYEEIISFERKVLSVVESVGI